MKNEPKREKRDTAESILVQKSGPALAVLLDRRRRPCIDMFLLHTQNLCLIENNNRNKSF